MDKKCFVNLNTVEKVKNFVGTVSRFDCDFDLVSGRYIIDAKSIMGVLSLDLSKNIELIIRARDEAQLDSVTDAIDGYIAA